jgi:hypothetical protein
VIRRLTVVSAALVLTGLVAMPVGAQDGGARQRPSGYSFGNPRLLTQQLIWGRLHGVRLLALACHERGDQLAALAYVDWLDRQWPRIRAAGRDLARHYFNGNQAPLAAIDGALNLTGSLNTPGDELMAACATLPQALAAPSNDLELYYAERREAIRRGDPEFPGAIWQETE